MSLKLGCSAVRISSKMAISVVVVLPCPVPDVGMPQALIFVRATSLLAGLREDVASATTSAAYPARIRSIAVW